MLSQDGVIVVGHRRAPVLRMIRSSLVSRGYVVHAAASAPECIAALDTLPVFALVLDVCLIDGASPHGGSLRAALLRSRLPVLLVSFEPSDHVVARDFPLASFTCRVDEVDEMLRAVERMSAPLAPA